MAASDIQQAAYLYKRIYIGNTPTDVAARRHPYWGMLKRKANNFGEDARYAIKFQNPQGVSDDFAKAQAGASSSKGIQMAMEPAVKYGVITLDGVSILRSRGKKAGFATLLRTETEGVLEELGDVLAHDAQRNKSGQVGQRLSVSGNVITLAAGAVRHFKVNMILEASLNADGTSRRTGTVTVTKVHPSTDSITVDNLAGITGFANNDFLFRTGEPGACIEGLEDHFPLAEPGGSDSFRGVNRSVYSDLLAGYRLPSAGASIEEDIGRIGIGIHMNGRQADAAFVNSVDHWNMVKRANLKVEFQSVGGKTGYGFNFFTVHTPCGNLKVYPDPDVPTNRIRVVNMKDACLAHADKPIHIIKDDGSMSMRQVNGDGIETRARSVTNQYFRDPASHGVGTI